MPVPPSRTLLLAALVAAAACDALLAPPEPCDGPGAAPVCLRLMASGLEFPIHVVSPPGHDWLVIVEQRGLVHLMEDGRLRPEPFLDLRDRALYPEEQGLLGLVFDPDFESNGIFYANYTDLAGRTRLSRFRVGPDPRVADPATEEQLLAVPRHFALHNAGDLQFDPDGYLWVATGDGFEPGTAQDVATLRGSILRVDVRGGGPYAIPQDNPFVGAPDALPEIWMYGFRHPWRFHIDHPTGLAYITDVGHERREELNVVPWHSPGANFGWAILEGSLCNEDGCSAEGTVLPTLEYGHDEGCAIIGGAVYRGSWFPELVGAYFYADFCGFLRSLRYDDGRVSDQREWLVDELGPIIALEPGPGGELWVMTMDGSVYRMDVR